jgi:hypothetical protein
VTEFSRAPTNRRHSKSFDRQSQESSGNHYAAGCRKRAFQFGHSSQPTSKEAILYPDHLRGGSPGPR